MSVVLPGMLVAGLLPAPTYAADCAAIKDSKARLACYDSAATSAQSPFCAALVKVVADVPSDFASLKEAPDTFPDLGGYKIYQAKNLVPGAKECNVWVDMRPGKMPGHVLCSFAVKAANEGALNSKVSEARDAAKGCFAKAGIAAQDKEAEFTVKDVALRFTASFKAGRPSSYDVTIGRNPTDQEIMDRAKAMTGKP